MVKLVKGSFETRLDPSRKIVNLSGWSCSDPVQSLHAANVLANILSHFIGEIHSLVLGLRLKSRPNTANQIHRTMKRQCVPQGEKPRKGSFWLKLYDFESIFG